MGESLIGTFPLVDHILNFEALDVAVVAAVRSGAAIRVGVARKRH